MKKKRGRCFLAGVLLVLMIGVSEDANLLVSEAFGGNIECSPDGKAWTVREPLANPADAGNQVNPSCWYPVGENFVTGIKSELEALKEGEHYYEYNRDDIVPIGEWRVAFPPAKCIHISYEGFHGLSYPLTRCGGSYYSGWNAYCADCGNVISSGNFYLSRNAVRVVNAIDVSLDYYYMCPSCGHLEQGRGVQHRCKAISANRYRVVYDANAEDALGQMQPSFHMYQNVEMYEGQPVMPCTKLSKNGFEREGYVFQGWNLLSDGSGRNFSDEQEILNLSAYDYELDPERGTVTLYAQWKLAQGTLWIDPAGGKYLGKSSPTEIAIAKLERYTVSADAVTPPTGYKVTFNTMGGEKIGPQKNKMMFDSWTLEEPSFGILNQEEYQFLGECGQEDWIRALYNPLEICLPEPVRKGYRFGGWYADRECLQQVGMQGEMYLPLEDTTLYACWVQLVLNAEANYFDNNGKGAVDLQWIHADGKNKEYILYQKTASSDFVRMNEQLWKTTNWPGAAAPDLAPPNIIEKKTIEKVRRQGDRITIMFQEPEDEGTEYFHQAVSYPRGNESPDAYSNITCTKVTTGIAGYYYKVDGKEKVQVTEQNADNRGEVLKVPKLTLTIGEGQKYLHLSAVDRAGNIGRSISVDLDNVLDENYWPLCTYPIEISSLVGEIQRGSVAEKEKNVFYVKADGRTPFALAYRGSMLGEAATNYQIDEAHFQFMEQKNEGSFVVLIPKGSISLMTQKLNAKELGRKTAGNSFVQAAMYCEVERQAYMRDVSVSQGFTLEKNYEGREIEVIPRVAAKTQNGMVYSDDVQDRLNGISIIGDGSAPDVFGADKLEGLLEKNRKTGEVLELDLTAEDKLSGVELFYAIIYNIDNHGQMTCYPDADGHIRVQLTEDNPIFRGDLQLTVYAVDKVGNENKLECGAVEFGLHAKVSRLLSPHNPIFKRGESGKLSITAWGFADKVEVIFPNGFGEELNQIFLYDMPTAKAEEEVEFMIPLALEEEEQYIIVVKAYKGGRLLEERPTLCTFWVHDTILGELRTRLR